MLRSISVENFRSFAEAAKIEIRPITILLGRNSAGKSSLTRLFPLLRQSMGRESSSPILWSTSMVDFGRIEDVINHTNPETPIELTFILPDQTLDVIGMQRRIRSSEVSEANRVSVTFKARLGKRSDGKTEYVSSEIVLGGDIITVHFDEGTVTKILINGRAFQYKRYADKIVTSGRLFPSVYFFSENDNVSGTPKTFDRMRMLLSKYIEVPSGSADEIRNSLAHRSLLSDYYSELVPFVSKQDLISYIEQRAVKNITDKFESDVDEIYRLSLFTRMGPVFDYVQRQLAPLFESVSYIGPVRASGLRFYRDTELSVERIDETGANLATYINSLSGSELRDFNNLLLDSFGVSVRSQSLTGHLSIELCSDPDGSWDNLADVGFGFSQLLPVVAQVHSSRRRHRGALKFGSSQFIMAIEQPELHLHPAFQAGLADLFAGAVSSQRKDADELCMILETHSEAMISRFGELVAAGRLDPELVAIHFVEKDEDTGLSTVRVTSYKQDGSIEDWPLGFFSRRN